MMDNQLTGSHTTSGPILNKDNFSHYLSAVSIGPISDLKYVPVTSKEMKDIKSLKNKNCGYDEISSKVLKSSMPFISSPLIYICNRSLSTGVFPSWLKYSQVHLIYKKGERSEISTYRLITVLASF
jgi:hypothetical protein